LVTPCPLEKLSRPHPQHITKRVQVLRFDLLEPPVSSEERIDGAEAQAAAGGLGHLIAAKVSLIEQLRQPETHDGSRGSSNGT
jgi:hypothetical protein